MSEERTDNFTMRAWLETIQSILGPHGLKSILNYGNLEKYIDNFPPDNEELDIPLEDLQALFYSLYELFGVKGARSLQLRIGHEIVNVGFEKRPTTIKAIQLAARVFSETKRIRLILENLINYEKNAYFSQLDKAPIEIREEEDWFMLVYRSHFESDTVTSDRPICYVTLGVIRTLVKWITGHEHDVEEIECRAKGDPADVFRVAKARKEEG